MKPLATTFDSKGFRFHQLMREKDIAIFQKTRILDGVALSSQNISFELIRVQKYPTYEIAGVEVPAHEAFPPSTKWGDEGRTYLAQDKAMDGMLAWLDEKPNSAIAGQPTGAPRGRKPSGFILEVPLDKPFLMSDLIAKYPDTPRPTLVVKLAELEGKGQVQRVGTQRSVSGRGKAAIRYQAIAV